MENVGIRAKVKDALDKIGMAHARIPSLFAAMDGKRNGNLFEAIIKPADEAATHEEQLKVHFAKRLFTAIRARNPGRSSLRNLRSAPRSR